MLADLLANEEVVAALAVILGAILTKLFPTKTDARWWNAIVGRFAPKAKVKDAQHTDDS